MYLIYYFPFKETHIMVSVLSGEISTGIFITSTVILAYGESKSTIALVETVMIYSIIGAIGIQFCVSLYSLKLSLQLLWNKVIKERAKNFLSRTIEFSTHSTHSMHSTIN